jgi:DNA-binding PadR family transcriptional regulator
VSDEPRLSGPTLKVLKLFVSAPRERRSGADITRAAGVGAGTLYPLLSRLEKHGWLEAEWEQQTPSEIGRPRKRLYRITAVGQTRALAALAEYQLPIGDLKWIS